MPVRAVCFDVMGTLFDLSPLGRRLKAAGAPHGSLDAWFAKLLHAATSLTLSGQFAPFPQLADRTLRALLVAWGIDEARAAEILDGLSELDPYPDAAAALERLSGGGVAVLALTNGSGDNTRGLLRRAELDRFVAHVVTTEEVGAYKPDRRVYARAVETLGLPTSEVALVAAHAWDVVGARAAGLQTVWVRRGEGPWPLPVEEPRSSKDLHEAATMLLSAATGPPAAGGR